MQLTAYKLVSVRRHKSGKNEYISIFDGRTRCVDVGLGVGLGLELELQFEWEL